eukprot:TRINITY_DN25374_c0_g1_i1.p1 TRINITY_DN25374_c0_g1~~TRINITY_DN25374_c0_g1_i1.p1  ORF type:complete len:263 (-),score=42.49 TRINITY_DN25374_c0_g1_i1:189-977(-)
MLRNLSAYLFWKVPQYVFRPLQRAPINLSCCNLQKWKSSPYSSRFHPLRESQDLIEKRKVSKVRKTWLQTKKNSANDLDEFIQTYDKSVSTTYYQGTRFEFEVINTLSKLNFDIKKTGQTLDRGVDFRGTWKLPGRDEGLAVIGQCKKERSKCGAKYIRELEGTLLHNTAGSIGIFVSSSGFTADAVSHFAQSSLPLILSIIEGDRAPLGLTHFKPNAAALQLLPSLVIGHKYQDLQHKRKVVVLMVDGVEVISQDSPQLPP